MKFALHLVEFCKSCLTGSGSPHTPRTKDWLARLFLLLLPPIFFWRETLGWLTLGDQDALFWFLPAYKFAAEQIRSGSFPLWNPNQYGGIPFFSEWQSGTLDPLNWIHWIGASSFTMTLANEASFAVALLAMFSYARSLGFTRRASIFAAVTFGLSGFLVGRTIYPGFIRIVALVPLVFCFTERLGQSGRWRDVTFGALVITWQIFAAHPQPLIYSSLLACAYAIFKVQISDAKKSFGFLLKFAVMFAGGIGLAAVQLLPAIDFATKSVRQNWPFESFTANSVHPISLLTTLFPFFHGSGKTIYQLPFWGNYWHHNEAQIYLGALAISLAAAGAIVAWRMRYRVAMFWSIAAVTGVLLVLGKYSGILAELLYHVPLLSHFRSPNRHWLEVLMAVAVLSGYAVDRLLTQDSRFISLSAQLSAIFVAVACVAVGSFALLRKGQTETLVRALPGLEYLPAGFLQLAKWEFLLPIIMAVCSCLAIVGFVRAKNRKRWFTPVFAILLLDFNLYAAFAPINNPQDLDSLIGRALPSALASIQNELQPIRYQMMLSPMTGEFNPFWFYGHEMLTGYDPVLNERHKVFSGLDETGRCFNQTMLEPQDKTLDILNVRYVFVPPNKPNNLGEKSEKPVVELKRGGRMTFYADEKVGDALTIISSLANSAEMTNDSEVADITVNCQSGGSWKTTLRAGRDTSEWAYDRADVRKTIKHARAPIAENFNVGDSPGFQGHFYKARVQLPKEVQTCSSRRLIQIAALTADDLTLTVKQITLENTALKQSTPLPTIGDAPLDDPIRWHEVADRSPASSYSDYRVFENLRALPRVWMVNRAQINWEGDQLKLIRGQLPGFAPQETALVDHETAAKLAPKLLGESKNAVTGKVVLISRSPTKILLEAETAEPSLIVLSEIFYPGWKAHINHAAADLLRVNYNLRGVQVPAGKHVVELSYWPESLTKGAAISLMTALGLLGVLFWEKRRSL